MSLQYFFTGIAAPTTTPARAGNIFVDTTAGRIYFATGTASSSDWDLMPVNISEITQDADLNQQGVRSLINAMAIDFQASAELVINSGVVTQTQSLHSIDTQSDSATDDLDTVTIATDKNFLVLKLENSARIVTIKHGTGNFSLPDATDLEMVPDALYQFYYDGANWIHAIGSSSAGSGITAKQAASGVDNNQTGTAYTLVLTDQDNKTIWMNNAASNTVTIPLNAAVAFNTGNKINIMMEGAGVTTIAGDTGVTVNGTSGGSVVINNQYQGATISKRGTDTWIVTGDIT